MSVYNLLFLINLLPGSNTLFSFQNVVFLIRNVYRDKLFVHAVFCLLLHHYRGSATDVRFGTDGSFSILWTRLDTDLHVGQYKDTL